MDASDLGEEISGDGHVCPVVVLGVFVETDELGVKG